MAIGKASRYQQKALSIVERQNVVSEQFI